MAVTCISNGLASPRRAKVGRYSINLTMPGSGVSRAGTARYCQTCQFRRVFLPECVLGPASIRHRRTPTSATQRPDAAPTVVGGRGCLQRRLAAFLRRRRLPRQFETQRTREQSLSQRRFAAPLVSRGFRDIPQNPLTCRSSNGGIVGSRAITRICIWTASS